MDTSGIFQRPTWTLSLKSLVEPSAPILTPWLASRQAGGCHVETSCPEAPRPRPPWRHTCPHCHLLSYQLLHRVYLQGAFCLRARTRWFHGAHNQIGKLFRNGGTFSLRPKVKSIGSPNQLGPDSRIRSDTSGKHTSQRHIIVSLKKAVSVTNEPKSLSQVTFALVTRSENV